MTYYDDPTDEWDETADDEVGGYAERVADEIPDGLYDAEVVDASIFRDKSGVWRVSWWFAIAAGVYSGSQIQKFEIFDGRARFHRADVRLVLGRVPRRDELLDVEAGRMRGPVRQQIVGAVVTVRQRTTTKGDRKYVDVYLNSLVRPSPRLETGEDAPQPPPERPAPVETTTDKPAALPTRETPAQRETPPGKADCPTCMGAGCESCSPLADIPF